MNYHRVYLIIRIYLRILKELAFQADDEGSTPFIRSYKARQSNDGLFLCKSICYKDLYKVYAGFFSVKTRRCRVK